MNDDQFLKIGFSFGRCIRDIVLERVHIDQVVVIITRTSIPTRDKIVEVIEQYQKRSDYLLGLDYYKCLNVALSLWDYKLIFQPLITGGNVTKVPSDYVWMNLIPTHHLDDPILLNLLRNYMMAAKLIDDTIDEQKIVLR